jgi:radical SAM superfamily enzyme YgiQ (UPF0313 family)
VKLLLINPRAPESFWSFRWAAEKILPSCRAINPPLGLATVAALTPASWEITIVDENVETIPLRPDADVIGIGGMAVQYGRQAELLRYYRERGHLVVAGGSYASLCPEKYQELADVVIAGEAERTWKQFCSDLENGTPRRLYVETGTIPLDESPVPRLDLLRLDQYAMPSLQLSRGCPFQCEFCDIIVMFGRRPRTKSLEQVERELDLLRSRGVRDVFFVDDNFIGNKPYAKRVLRHLIDYQERHRVSFRFGTEASVNVSQDDELLHLLSRANFMWLFLGIETPDHESLREAGKLQNTREDLVTSIRRIYSHGIDVFGGFIIGFDNDTLETIERQHRFILDSGIQVAMVGLLQALPRTPLYQRLEAEGRLSPDDAYDDNTRFTTNVIPKLMDPKAMVEGCEQLYRRLTSDEGIEGRIREKLRHFKSRALGSGYSVREELGILGRFLRHGIACGGWRRLRAFWRSLGTSSIRQIPFVISEWISGLSMQDFVKRHLSVDLDRERRLAESLFSRLEHRLSRYRSRGSVDLALVDQPSTPPAVRLRISGLVDRMFFSRVARGLKPWLRRTRSTVVLHLEQIDLADLSHLQAFLRKLSAYGDRITLAVSEALPSIPEIDSSRFRIIITPA